MVNSQPFFYMILSKPTQSLLQMLGPSILFVSLSLSGGELLLWPNLVTKYGLTIMWFLPIVLVLQYVVNIEIERYTVVTGKNTLAGLIALTPFLKYFFPIVIAISLVWPAWISTAGNALAYGLGFPQYGAWLSAALLLCMLVLWQSKKSYAKMEGIAKFGLVLVLTVVAYAVYHVFSLSIVSDSLVNGSWFPYSVDSVAFIAALAYGGVAGVLNLVQSDWIKSRCYAAACVVEPDAIHWEHEETKQNWKHWWYKIRLEHFLLFIVGNLVGIFLLSTLAVLLLGNTVVNGFRVITSEIDALNALSPYVGLLFSIGVFLVFWMAQMTILDACGRLLKQCVSTSYSHERLSQFVGLAGVVILIGTAIIPGFNQPASLLHISAVISAGVMAVYPPLLLRLNSYLPEYTRPKYVVPLVWLCSLFYGGMVLWGVWTWLV